MTRTRAIILSTTALFAALAGAASGGWTRTQSVTAACPQTECEFGIYCTENTGNNTMCSPTGDGSTCKTRACEPE